MKSVRVSSIAVCLYFICISHLIYGKDRAYNFPIRPGTVEWNNFKNYSERLNAYNVPSEVLDSMSTPHLVKTCLDYPEFRLILTRNNLQQGYDYLKTIFNGFDALEKREDAAKELLMELKRNPPTNINKYNSSLEKGRFSLRRSHIEILLAQYSILSPIDAATKNDILSVCSSNIDTIKNLTRDYGSFHLTLPSLIIGRLLLPRTSAVKSSSSEEHTRIEEFLTTSEGLNSELFEFIMVLSKSKAKTTHHD